MKPGEVWIVDLGTVSKVRPVLVVSREDTDPPRALSVVVPFTRAGRGSRYEIPMPNLRFISGDSVVNVQGIQAVENVHFQRRLGAIGANPLRQVREAIRWMLDL